MRPISAVMTLLCAVGSFAAWQVGGLLAAVDGLFIPTTLFIAFALGTLHYARNTVRSN
jgi:hypothetical protein